MKLEAVFDAKGTIVAAILFEGDESRPRPVPSKGQSVGVFDVPERCAKIPLRELCMSMRIDRKGGQLVDLHPNSPPHESQTDSCRPPQS